MPFFAIFLLIISAVFHTSWNFLLKNSENKFIVIWWGLLIGSIVFSPLLFYYGLPQPQVWKWFLVSVLVEIVYYISLSISYQIEDFSIVYPFARGSAPVFLLLWSTVILKEELTPGGLVGIIALISGLFILTSGSIDLKRSAKRPIGLLMATFLGFLISIYTVIDGSMVKLTSPISYAALLFFCIPILTFPLMMQTFGWRQMKDVIKAQPLRVSTIGIFSVLAYLLTLVAYQTTKIGYSGSVREISVVFGALAGWLVLKESFGKRRLVGSVVLFAGLLCIGIFG
jgi:drug/metabolite transporter (DMT)-like permease